MKEKHTQAGEGGSSTSLVGFGALGQLLKEVEKGRGSSDVGGGMRRRGGEEWNKWRERVFEKTENRACAKAPVDRLRLVQHVGIFSIYHLHIPHISFYAIFCKNLKILDCLKF